MSNLDDLNLSTANEVRPSFIWGPLPHPWDIKKIQPELHVYRQNQKRVVINYYTSPEDAVNELMRENMLPTSRFIFITHGFESNIDNKWLHDMKNGIISKDNQTVAIVGWGKGSDIGLSNYKQAAANTQAVGEWLAGYAKAIKNYKSYLGIFDQIPDPDSNISFRRVSSLQNLVSTSIGDNVDISSNIEIWGIGHSLGAHLMGKAGRTSKIFNRITGLDPAGPNFQTENIEKRLSKTDATFVDVIHTDGSGIKYLGTILPLGTVDFYPNFGCSQPTKDKPEVKSNKLGFSSDSMKNQECQTDGYFKTLGKISHNRAYEYFIWSISNPNKFKTNLMLKETPTVEKNMHNIYPNVTPVKEVEWVNTTAEMGYYADKVKTINSGNYYVHTNANDPWL